MPGPIALMRLILESETFEAASARLAGSPAAAELTPARYAAVKAVAAAVDHAGAATPESIAVAFDRAAAASPEAGAALYSLGDPALLAAVTDEVVDWMTAEALVSPSSRVVEVGCGAGRFLRALAPRAILALGLDVSAGMVAEAGRRCAALANALPARSAGRDLACVASGAVDLLLFADSFPYLVQVGAGLPQRHFAEAARVLSPGGRMLILNYSYRGDPAADRREAEALARARALRPLPCAPPGFQRWDATAYLFGRGR